MFKLLTIISVEYLKPIAAREKEAEEAQAKERAELEAIRKAEAAKSMFTFLIIFLLWSSWLATKLYSAAVLIGTIFIACMKGQFRLQFDGMTWY